jgi:hypothetical protein
MMHNIQGRKQMNVYAFVDEPPLLKDLKKLMQRLLVKSQNLDISIDSSSLPEYNLDYIIKEVRKERNSKYNPSNVINRKIVKEQ